MSNNSTISLLLTILLVILSAGCVTNQVPGPDSMSPVATKDMTGDSTSGSLAPNPAALGTVSRTMSLDVPAQANPETILVYRTVTPDVSLNRLEKYIRIFHVDGSINDNEKTIFTQTEDLTYYIEIGKASGNVRYNVQNRTDNALDSPDKLPTDEDAVKIATQFLKDNGIFPEGAKTGKPKRYFAVSTDKNGNEIQHAGHVEVWFGRKLNDLDVWGTQLYVDIGGNGDIIGYYANWREYAPAGEYPIKTRETAFEELKQTGIRTDSGDASISITEATLAYRTKAGAYDEVYLEPIWVFSGDASSGKDGSNPVSKFIPALTDEAVKSLSSS